MQRRSGVYAWGLGTALLAGSLVGQVKVDPTLPAYEKGAGISGSVKSIGSDTMINLMGYWVEGFRKMYPNVEIATEGKGSGTAPPALIAGTATFGPMSRAMKAQESDDFEKAFGYKPTQLPTAIDMLAVYVHKDNPIAQQGLTLAQVDAIFSKTRKRGNDADIRTWGQLGLTGDWADKPIRMFGRNSASGTYGYFKENTLAGGDFKDEVKEQPGSAAVVQGVGSDKYAIGYSGIGYHNVDVLVVPLAKDKASKPVPATADRIADYPLTRYLYLTINYKPGSQLEPLRREFLRYVFSSEGQTDVVRAEFLPLSFKVAAKSLQMVGLDMKPAAAPADASGPK